MEDLKETNQIQFITTSKGITPENSTLETLGIAPNNFYKEIEIAFLSKLLPKEINTLEKAILVALKGRELGLGSMASFDLIDIIQNKPSLKAQGMLALLYKAGHSFRIIKDFERIVDDNKKEDRITIVGFKRKGDLILEGGEPILKTASFLMSEATSMKYTSKEQWVKQPHVMLLWRAISKGMRLYFPDLIQGMYETTEVLDFTGAS